MLQLNLPENAYIPGLPEKAVDVVSLKDSFWEVVRGSLAELSREYHAFWHH